MARGRETFSGCLQAKINADKGDVPYFIQFDHFPSSFVEVAALLHGPPTELFPLFLDTFFAMPVMREDGTRLSFEQVSRALDELAIDFGAQTLGEGPSSVFSRVLALRHTLTTFDPGILVRIQVAKEDYEKAIVWLSDVIYGTQLDDVDRCACAPFPFPRDSATDSRALFTASRASSTRRCRTFRAKRRTRSVSLRRRSRTCSSRPAGAWMKRLQASSPDHH